ncbi:grifin isoform X2 [Saccopteryx bilineata]|uniref:grifin isoform X2 n=1 Tax=Saccopteryx bilineata TaxID=59482 RepID=UPI00338D410D
MAVQFEAFCAEGLAPGWSLLVQGHSDSGEDKFEINFLSEAGDIAFHIKPRFASATMVGNAFQGGCWGQEEVSSVFPLMEVSSDAQHFHVHAQEHKVLQFAHRLRPLAAITRVQVLSDHRLAQGWGLLSQARSPRSESLGHQPPNAQWRAPWGSCGRGVWLWGALPLSASPPGIKSEQSAGAWLPREGGGQTVPAGLPWDHWAHTPSDRLLGRPQASSSTPASCGRRGGLLPVSPLPTWK